MNAIALIFAAATAIGEVNAGIERVRALEIENCEITSVKSVNNETHIAYTLRPSTNSYIRCTLSLAAPEEWDGRFWGHGNGAWAGHVDEISPKGSARAHTDLGTSRTTRNDVGECFDVFLDYHCRATHLMTVSAKLMTEAFYGRKISQSYFRGASCGGRQGVIEAGLYPDDYDGILSEVPGFVEHSRIGHIWKREQLKKKYGKWFSKDEIAAVRKAELDYFAKSDPEWARGKFILDPNPTSGKLDGCWKEIVKNTPALADREQLWRELFDPIIIKGRYFCAGRLIGIEFDSAWSFIMTKHLNKNQPPASFTEEDLDKMLDDQVAWASSDLRSFTARGGKLIMFGGYEDLSCTVPEMTEFYDAAAEKCGGVERLREHVRFFREPGRTHGAKGEPGGSGLVGQMQRKEETLIDWVEKGNAPEWLDFAWTDNSGRILSVRSYPSNEVKCR